MTLRHQGWAPASVWLRGKEPGVVGMEVACARGQVCSRVEITGASYKSLWGHTEKNSVKSVDAQLRKGPVTQVLGPVMSGTMSDQAPRPTEGWGIQGRSTTGWQAPPSKANNCKNGAPPLHTPVAVWQGVSPAAGPGSPVHPAGSSGKESHQLPDW